MKKIIFILIILVPILSFSQDLLSYKSGGRVYNFEDKKLNSENVRSILSTNSEALKLYNAGRAKKTWGNVLLYGGISTIAINHYLLLQNNKDGVHSNAGRNVPYIVGGALILTAIPIKIGFSRKIRKSVDLINEDLKNAPTGFNIDSSSFVVNSDGIGISITF